MAINLTDFDKIWASSSPLTPYSFTDANYEEGWNFVGSTPPARQMWDGYMKWSDEKQQYIVNNFLPLAGGTMTGDIVYDKSTFYIKSSTDDKDIIVASGSSWDKGGMLHLWAKDHDTYQGIFSLTAQDGVDSSTLTGYPNGNLIWKGKTIPVKDVNIQTGKTESTSVNANSSTTIAITFSPVFASNPIVLATVQTGYVGFYASVGSISTSSASITVNNASSNTRSVVVGWVAIDI